MKAKRNLLALVVCSLIILIVYRLPVVSGQTRLSMEILFRIMIAVIMMGVTWRWNKYVASFLGLALFSQFYPMQDTYSVMAFRNVFYGTLLYYILVSHGKGWVDSLMDMMCVLALCNVVLAFTQTLGFNPLWKDADGVIAGFMENQNSLSASLALCLPAFFRDRWKWFAPLVVVGLFLAKSSGGVAAVAVGFSFYTLITVKERKFLYPIGMGIILMAAIFIMFFDQYQSLDIRMEAWSHAWHLFKDNWLVGCSIGRWQTEFVYLAIYKGFPEGFIRLHSTILQSMLEMGIGFIIILGLYLVDIVRRSWKQWTAMATPLTALIIILTNGSVNFLIRIAPNAALVIVWLAIMELSLRRLKDETFMRNRSA